MLLQKPPCAGVTDLAQNTFLLCKELKSGVMVRFAMNTNVPGHESENQRREFEKGKKNNHKTKRCLFVSRSQTEDQDWRHSTTTQFHKGPVERLRKLLSHRRVSFHSGDF